MRVEGFVSSIAWMSETRSSEYPTMGDACMLES